MEIGNLVRLSESPRPEGAEWSPLEWFLCLEKTQPNELVAWKLKSLDGNSYIVEDSKLKKEYNFKELEFQKAEDLVEYLQLLNLKLDISNASPKGLTEAELLQQQMQAYASAIKHSITTTVPLSPYGGTTSAWPVTGSFTVTGTSASPITQTHIWPFGK